MRGFWRPGLWAVSVLLAGAVACSGPTEEAAEDTAAEPAGGETITIWTDRTELFFEHPPLIAGQPGEAWAIHFTDLSDFSAVTQGRLTLEFFGPEELSIVSEAPSRPGHYGPAPRFDTPGMYDLIMILEGDQVTDEIFVGPVQVFASADDIPVLPEEEAVGISFLKEQQWPIDFRTAVAERREVTSGAEVTGLLQATDDRSANVTAPVDGIVRFALNRNAPAEGARVAAGELLIRLSPSAEDGALADLQARAERLEREVARAERLVAAEAIPARRLEEARHDLEVARAQLEAVDASGDGYGLELRAPLAGVITERLVASGQRVSAGDPLFTVVDPSELKLVLHAPPALSGELGAVRAATFHAEGGAEAVRTDRLMGVAAALDPVRRTIPVTFRISNADGALKPGMLVTGRLLTGETVEEVAVPNEALVDEDGLIVAYVQIAGESFERRAVEVGVTDGQWTTVISGVRSGERVVVVGQYPIKLSSLNTNEISDHGHPH